MSKLPKKILLIDDDPFYVKVLTDVFRDGGFTVFSAFDGVEGVRMFTETSPDAVICDLVMPNMCGVSTCTEITSLAGDSLPVMVMLTSMFQNEPPHEHDIPELGAKFHIPKSIPPVNIVIIVEQLLERDRHG